MSSSALPAFSDLSLSAPVLKALQKVGYEVPSSIQAAIIPYVLQGRDVIGQAQTGTGKTAAFALPILSKIDLSIQTPQILVLAPTRELAIQVAEAFQRYASEMKGFHVLPIYGGQEYGIQLRQLKRGAHVVVGTPGRVMDHMRRGTLKLNALSCLVLDEADEMLRMGFIDDVEWILEQLPAKRQIALFSATMPAPIRKISKRYLNDPEQITVQAKSITAETIQQRYLFVNGRDKLSALTSLLEAMQFNAIIVFVRTKIETLELTEKLSARGYACSALNGDITQRIREATIKRFKKGELDILVATDVAARGLDVERVSHVINYDIPNDPEAYTHRIGRTGRAGRSGESILFVTQREKHLLRTIEKVTGKDIERMQMPSTETINRERIQRFKQQMGEALSSPDMDPFRKIIEDFRKEMNVPTLDLAAALAAMAQGQQRFLLADKPQHRSEKPARNQGKDRPGKDRQGRDRPGKGKPANDRPADDMERFRLEVGTKHGITAANIVGAIANEAGLEGQYIQNLRINEHYSIVDLPSEMPRAIFRDLQKTRVGGQQLNISRLDDDMPQKPKSDNHKNRKPSTKKRKPKSAAGKNRRRKPKSAS